MRLAGTLLTLIFAGLASSAVAQPSDERRGFLQQVSQQLFGSPSPENPIDGGRKGWTVLMLAPPATSLAALTEGYNGVTADLSRAWSALTVFDRPVEYRNGYAVLSPRTIDIIWDEALTNLMPPVVAPSIPMSRTAAHRWLYACGARPPLRASKFMEVYRKYQDLVRILISGKESELWRLHPDLKRYKSYEAAYAAVNRDWLRYGYKDQIDAAIKIIDTERNTAAWRKWSVLRNAFEVNRIQVDVVRAIPQTIMLPQPGTWGETTFWARASVTTSAGQRFNFHIARVKIIRPWLDLDTMLANPDLFDNRTAETSIPLSDGTVPTATDFPSGALPAFVDELILVRHVRIEGDGAAASPHPLAAFAYPDAVNLLGYIVRTLPKSPS